MEKLQISVEEATQLWEDDNEDYIGESGEEMTKKAKQVKRYEQSAEPKKKREPKPKVVDEDKKHLIELLQIGLKDIDFTVTNDERLIDFEYNGNKYNVMLTKKRKGKA